MEKKLRPIELARRAGERVVLLKALELHPGKRQDQADCLGIALRTLQYLLARHGLTKGTVSLH